MSYFCGNRLIRKDEKNFHTVAPVFSQFCCFLQQKYGLGLGLRFGLSVDLLLYRLAPQRLSLKTQSRIEFLGPLSSCRKVLVYNTALVGFPLALVNSS